MKLWLATTEPAQAAEGFALGLFQGVLTNPSLLAAAGRPAAATLGALCAAVPGPVFCQLRDADAATMRAEADRWLDRGWKNLGIKVPLTREGCTVLHWLREQGVVHRLATCVPTVTQVLLAAALEVPWITPTGSVLEKLGGPAKADLVADMQAVLERQRSATRLIPSLSSPAEMQALARVGVSHGFVWAKDVARFVDSELVRDGVAAFAPAWAELARLETANQG